MKIPSILGYFRARRSRKRLGWPTTIIFTCAEKTPSLNSEPREEYLMLHTLFDTYVPERVGTVSICLKCAAAGLRSSPVLVRYAMDVFPL